MGVNHDSLIEKHFGMETVVITENCEVLQLQQTERSLWFALKKTKTEWVFPVWKWIYCKNCVSSNTNGIGYDSIVTCSLPIISVIKWSNGIFLMYSYRDLNSCFVLFNPGQCVIWEEATAKCDSHNSTRTKKGEQTFGGNVTNSCCEQNIPQEGSL